MTHEELINHFGSEIKAAVEIGVSQMTINNWKRNGVPRLMQLAIQALTKNKLKADSE